MFRGGPEGLTVSDPESGVFSTHELENMGCEDDDEYSSKIITVQSPLILESGRLSTIFNINANIVPD